MNKKPKRRSKKIKRYFSKVGKSHSKHKRDRLVKVETIEGDLFIDPITEFENYLMSKLN
jgi:hypothetical protein